jgi:hypothetical protein
MRRRKTTRSKTTRRVSRRGRSRSMGKINAMDLNQVVATIGGAIASRLIVNNLAKVQGLANVIGTPYTKAGSQIVLGLVTPMIAGKSPMAKAFANGMTIGGGIELFKALAPNYLGADESDVIVVSGLDEIGAMDMLGAGEINEINGTDEISEINGMDDYDYNY